MISHITNTCRECVARVKHLGLRYRQFLLEPGSLVTIASGLLLVLAFIQNPGRLIGGTEQGSSLLYLASALVGSAYIWWSAIQGIRARDFTADIPVSLATLGAIAIGEYAAAAVVAVLLLFGGLLESFVAARAGHALEALASLLPDRVTVRRASGDVIIPLDEVRSGDIVLVRPGERIAVDGEVAGGEALVNEAAITGESVPLEKQAGDQVFAGTLSQVGALEVRATRVGGDTTLGQIRRMIADAQSQQAPVERMLDRYARLYTPVALILGALLWWWTGDIMRAITVLIVFCPCVMVLATPTALVAAVGNAALRGNLIKMGATIEALARVDTVVFDKTGTLTLGEPRLVEIVCLDGRTEHELLRLSASAELFSEHPFGRATVSAARSRGLQLVDPVEFEARPGGGVAAVVNGDAVVLGHAGWLEQRGVALVPLLDERLKAEGRKGRNAIPLAINREVSGLLVFEDLLRPAAAETAAKLRSMALQTVLISGDRKEVARRVAAEMGIQELYAEVLPEQKAAIVGQLKAKGRRVAFVGDGVNDGPALATADVGIAMGVTGTDVAIETAQVALLSDDLSRLPELIILARKAVQVIKVNLAFSLLVLAAAVGLTVAGVLTPVTGALLHELSSIPVIANSARLLGFRRDAAPGPASARHVAG